MGVDLSCSLTTQGVYMEGLGQPFYNFEQNLQQRVNLCAGLLWEASCAWWRVPVLPGPVGEGQPLCQATQMIPTGWWPLVLELNTRGCHLGSGEFFMGVLCESHTNIVACSCRLEVLTNPGNTCLLPGCSAPGTVRWGAALGGSNLNCRRFSLLMLDSTDALFHETVPW